MPFLQNRDDSLGDNVFPLHKFCEIELLDLAAWSVSKKMLGLIKWDSLPQMLDRSTYGFHTNSTAIATSTLQFEA
jgi:hypothetical protein